MSSWHRVAASGALPRRLGVALVLHTWLLSARARAEAAPPLQEATEEDEIVRPLPKTSLEVAYPEGAQGSSGVELDLWIDKEGTLTRVEVFRGDAPFAAAAKQAASTWRFSPARRHGRAVAAHIRISVAFAEPARQVEGAPEAPRSPATASAVQPAKASQTLAVSAQPASVNEKPVIVEVRGVRTGGASVTFSREAVRELPGAFGDPFRAVEIMPGITPTTSGHPYFYVRGAPPGNVGYYFDDIPLPVLYHAVNGPAVLQPAFIDSVTDRLKETVRDTDRCSRSTEEFFWIMLPHTDAKGLDTVKQRLGKVAELFSAPETSDISLRVISITAPHDLLDQEDGELLLARLAGELG